jgi:non-ribosomal peptide synthetase component E (peptide arylation enzyme)
MKEKAYLEGAVPYSQEVVEEYAAKGWWLNETYGDMLDHTVELHGDRIAVIDERTSLTYRELKGRVDRLAIAFVRLGVKKYDRMLFQLPNRHEYIVAFFAAHRIGAIPTLTVARQEYQEISHFFRLVDPVGWLVPAREGKRDFRELIGKIRKETESLEYLIMVNDGEALPDGAFSFSDLVESVAPADYPSDYLARLRPDPNDVAVIFTTGGTTGVPKGVPRTHNSFLASIRTSTREVLPGDVRALVTPIGHTMANQGTIGGAMMHGATVVLLPTPRATEMIKAIEKYRITDIDLVPTQLEDLLNSPDLPHHDLTSLKRLITVGAALRPETAERAREFMAKIGGEFGGGGFGSTEGPSAGRSRTAKDGPPIPRGAVGLPGCEGDHWKVIDENEHELPSGTEGELVAKGPCVFMGYFRSEAENKTIFTADGYYKMGDLGTIDEHGYIAITGRKKDIIQRGGEGIIPKQIEDLLHQLPQVERSAVVAMPDPRLGEKACAYVVLKAGATLTFDGMVQSLKERGAGVLLLPERLEIVDDLPKTEVGKIDKKALVRVITEKLKGEGALP